MIADENSNWDLSYFPQQAENQSGNSSSLPLARCSSPSLSTSFYVKQPHDQPPNELSTASFQNGSQKSRRKIGRSSVIRSQAGEGRTRVPPPLPLPPFKQLQSHLPLFYPIHLHTHALPQKWLHNLRTTGNRSSQRTSTRPTVSPPLESPSPPPPPPTPRRRPTLRPQEISTSRPGRILVRIWRTDLGSRNLRGR